MRDNIHAVWNELKDSQATASAAAATRVLAQVHAAPTSRATGAKGKTPTTKHPGRRASARPKPPPHTSSLVSAPSIENEAVKQDLTSQELADPPESAVKLLQRLARAIQQVNDDDASARGRGLKSLSVVFLGGEPRKGVDVLPEATVAEMLFVLSRPLLRCFADPVERHREAAITIYTALAERVVDLAPHLPYVFPVLLSRCTSACFFDAELELFVFDVDALDAFKRGKAIRRPDFDHAFERERIVHVAEPSEELRLLLCKLLLVLVLGPAKRGAFASLVAYLHDALMLLAGSVRDPFAAAQTCAAEGISALCVATEFQEGLVPYATALARVVMPMLRHRHARVRVAAVHALHRAVAVCHRAKCKGAGTAAIADLVGFREENVIPTASFYAPEVRFNYVADLTRDTSVAVRRAMAECLSDWFTTLLDRRDHQPRLLPYMLNYAIDESEEVRFVAIGGIEAAGKEFASEARGDDVIERLQYGIDGNQRANHDPSGIPWPFESRPPLGARLIVRAFVHRIIQPTLNELANWKTEARRQSALLFRVIIVYCEDHLTQELARIVNSLCKAFKVIRQEKYEVEQRALLLDCCATLGRYVVPETALQFLSPRVRGDLEVLPGGTDAHARADVACILCALIRGAKPSTLIPQMTKLVELYTDDKLIRTEDVQLRNALLYAVTEFLSVLRCRGRAAMEAAFAATGRLSSLDGAITSMLCAIIAWRSMARPSTEEERAQTSSLPEDDDSKCLLLSKAALETLASIDVDLEPDHDRKSRTSLHPVAQLVVRRIPPWLVNGQVTFEHDIIDCDSVEFRILEEALTLTAHAPFDRSVVQAVPVVSCGSKCVRSICALLRSALDVARGALSAVVQDEVRRQTVRRLSEALIRPLHLASRVIDKLVTEDDGNNELRSLATAWMRDFALNPNWPSFDDSKQSKLLSLARSRLLNVLMCSTSQTRSSLLTPALTRDFAAVTIDVLLERYDDVLAESAIDGQQTLRSVAQLLGACAVDSHKQTIGLTTEDAQVAVGFTASSKRAFDVACVLLHDDRYRDEALSIMWEVSPLVRDDTVSVHPGKPAVVYTEFIKCLLPLLNAEFDEEGDVNFSCPSFEAQVDALLRAAAVRNLGGFQHILAQYMAQTRRTNVLCSLHDHATLLSNLALAKLGTKATSCSSGQEGQAETGVLSCPLRKCGDVVELENEGRT